MESVLKTKGLDFLVTHGEALTKIGQVLSSAGDIPGAGVVMKIFGSIFSYAGGLGTARKAEADAIHEALESLITDLGKTATLIQSWPEETRTKPLYLEVQTDFAAVQYWSEQIEKGKQPKDLVASLKRKSDRLHKEVQLAILDFSQKNFQLSGSIADEQKSQRDILKENNLLLKDILAALKLKEETPEKKYIFKPLAMGAPLPYGRIVKPSEISPKISEITPKKTIRTDDWVCDYCQYYNPKTQVHCERCQWACNRCIIPNSNENSHCYLCKYPNPLKF